MAITKEVLDELTNDGGGTDRTNRVSENRIGRKGDKQPEERETVKDATDGSVAYGNRGSP